MKGVRTFDVERSGERREDHVIVEEPLRIRIAGETLAVTMRTPGHDRELVLGFLLSEGVIAGAGDVSTMSPCAKEENTMDVVLSPGVKLPVDPDTGMLAKRGTLTSSACGVCGRVAIDDLIARVEPLAPGGPTVRREVVTDGMRALRDRQPLFRETGGCHAASLVTFAGEHVATFEDVGRHNAVDKVIGHCVRTGKLPLEAHVLLVSGRSSFEIVQKAVMARIPVVAAVSASTSLAVDLARRANVTLVGFVREGSLTVYSDGQAAARLR